MNARVVRRFVSTMSVAVVGVLVLLSPTGARAEQKPRLVREVAAPGGEPYSTLFTISLSNGNGTVANSPDPVPTDRRLVIEFVSVSVIVPPSETPRFSLYDSINGAAHYYTLPLTYAGPNGLYDEYRVAQAVKLYHDGNGANGPGADCARLQNSFSFMQCTITISGYLVPK